MPTRRARLARECNEHFAKIVADHPGRYGMFAVVPLARCRRLPARDRVRARHAQGRRHRPLHELWRHVSRRRRLRAGVRRSSIAARPSSIPTRARPIAAPTCCRKFPKRSSNTATDTTRTIASLVFSGTAARCPDVSFLFSHAGGTMPFLIGRFLGLARSPQFAPRLPNGVLHELQHLLLQLRRPPIPARQRR